MYEPLEAEMGIKASNDASITGGLFRELALTSKRFGRLYKARNIGSLEGGVKFMSKSKM